MSLGVGYIDFSHDCPFCEVTQGHHGYLVNSLVIHHTPLMFNIDPENRTFRKARIVFQPSFFRYMLNFPGRKSLRTPAFIIRGDFVAPKKLFFWVTRYLKPKYQLTGASFDRPFSCMVQGENHPSGAANSGSSATNMGSIHFWVSGGFSYRIHPPKTTLQEMFGRFFFFFKSPT